MPKPKRRLPTQPLRKLPTQPRTFEERRKAVGPMSNYPHLQAWGHLNPKFFNPNGQAATPRKSGSVSGLPDFLATAFPSPPPPARNIFQDKAQEIEQGYVQSLHRPFQTQPLPPGAPPIDNSLPQAPDLLNPQPLQGAGQFQVADPPIGRQFIAAPSKPWVPPAPSRPGQAPDPMARPQLPQFVGSSYSSGVPNISLKGHLQSVAPWAQVNNPGPPQVFNQGTQQQGQQSQFMDTYNQSLQRAMERNGASAMQRRGEAARSFAANPTMPQSMDAAASLQGRLTASGRPYPTNPPVENSLVNSVVGENGDYSVQRTPDGGYDFGDAGDKNLRALQANKGPGEFSGTMPLPMGSTMKMEGGRMVGRGNYSPERANELGILQLGVPDLNNPGQRQMVEDRNPMYDRQNANTRRMKNLLASRYRPGRGGRPLPVRNTQPVVPQPRQPDPAQAARQEQIRNQQLRFQILEQLSPMLRSDYVKPADLLKALQDIERQILEGNNTSQQPQFPPPKLSDAAPPPSEQPPKGRTINIPTAPTRAISPFSHRQRGMTPLPNMGSAIFP